MQTTLIHEEAFDLSTGTAKSSAAAASAASHAQKSKQSKLQVKPDSLWLTLALAAASAALVCALWHLDIFAPLQAALFGMSHRAALKLNQPLVVIAWAFLTVVAVAVGYRLERSRSSRRALIYLAGIVALWYVAGAVAAHFANFDMLFVPTIFVVGLTAIAARIRPLWRIDRELSSSIRRLAMTTHLLEGKRADARMTSGLQLLSTVLPLDEIVVFQLGESGELTAAGRSRDGVTDKMDTKPKHHEWREGVDLCDEAVRTGLPAVQHMSGAPGAARVAVPLIHENCTLGALLVKFRENFEPEDKNLLVAFASQLARNFQRQDVRENNFEPTFFDSLSSRAAQYRLDSFRLVSGLLSEQQFGSLAFAEMVDGYAVAYLDGTLAYANRQMLKAAQITGDRARQLDLFGLLDRFRGGVFDDPRIAIRRVMQTGESYRHEIYVEERSQTLDLQITLIHELADGKAIHETMALTTTPLCFIVTVRDISVQKENEKLRSDMVSLMSHELRTPITSINGFAELLMLEDNIPEESKEFLRIISTESQRLSRMLSTFLAVSKLEQGDKREVIKIPIRLDAVVHEVLQNQQPEAKRKRIRLVEQANAHLPPVAGDKGLMTKVVAHLVDNAIRYSPERTSVTVSTVLEADAVRVIVEDRGFGVPTDSLEKIWEKFYRVPREGLDKEETSTGLGLSFVKEVVENHGGSVFVESEPNQGSKFSFTLPRL